MASVPGTLSRLPLVGRATELAELRAALARARAGSPAVVLLSGEGGVGKTRLSGFLAEEARLAGWTVAAGRTYPVESGAPYALFADALVPLLRALGPSTLSDLSRGAEAQLAQLFPPIRALVHGPDAGDVTPANRTALFWTFAEFMKSLAGRGPLLLVLDDLHWADAASLELLHFLVRQLASEPIAIIATVNDSERDAPPTLRATLKSLESMDGVIARRLEPLTRDGTAELVRHAFGVDESVTREFTALLLGWTRGNPFFLEETLKTLVESGRLRQDSGAWLGWELDRLDLPRTIHDAIEDRFATLDSGAREIAELIAVIGARASYATIRSVSGMTDDALVTTLKVLRLRNIIQEEEGTRDPVYDFCHPMLGQVMLAQAGLARRRLLHARIGETLEAAYGDAAIDHADELAHHFVQGDSSELSERAAKYLATAGQSALARFANREAVAYLEAALARLPADQDVERRERVVENLARALQRRGEFDRAIALHLELHAAAEQRDDFSASSNALRRIAVAHFRAGRPREAIAAYDDALAAADRARDLVLIAHIRLGRGAVLQSIGRVEDSIGDLHDALDAAERAHDDPLQARAHRELLLFHTMAGPPERARHHGESAITLALASGDRALASTCHWAMSVLEGLTGHVDDCARHIQLSTELAEELHSPLLRLAIDEVHVEWAYSLGAWDTGLALGERAIALARSLQQKQMLPRLLVWTAMILLGRYQLERAKAYIDEAWMLSGAGDPDHAHDVHTVVPAHIGRAHYHMTILEWEETIRLGREGLAIVDATGARTWAVHRLLPIIAEAQLYSFDSAGARETGERLRRESETMGNVLGLAWADTCDAIIAYRERGAEAAVPLMRAAAERLEAVPYIPSAARLRRQLAGRLAEIGDRDGAIRELRCAHDTFVRLGATWELDRTRVQFEQLGVDPPAQTSGQGTETLTERELEIVRLVAAEKSNKAIGEALHISPRTVSTHLSSLARRLSGAPPVESGTEDPEDISPTALASGVDSHERVLAQRYALVRLLGQGGMGTVYLARDLKYDRLVAVKFLGDRDRFFGDASRFLAEIRTAARLNHPHILTVFDSGEEDGALYYVMPCVEGSSLRERMGSETRLPVGEAVAIARQIADALGYAHAQGVVHRDIKPENVLIDRQGHAWVADFGLAHARSTVASSRLTAPGLTVGSPAYMSPEQAAGDEEVDGRSDLYSLGCVLFEMLLGRPPFQSDRGHEVMRRHLTEVPPSVRARRADVPTELDHILARLLAKAPDERFATAHVLRAALDRIAPAGSDTRPLRTPASWLVRSARALRTLPRAHALLIVAGLTIPLTLWAVHSELGGARVGGLEPDSSVYAVLPFRTTSAGDAVLPHHLMLRDAFARWQDLDVVDPMRTADVVARRGGVANLTSSQAVATARELGAGRFVHGTEAMLGDSVRLSASLHDASADGRVLRTASIKIPARGLASLAAYASLADSLLFGRTTVGSVAGDDIGTRSGRARDAYGRAHAALESWDLRTADSLFAAAVESDPNFVRAHLWMAQVRNWLALPPEHWSNHADMAATASDRLTVRERHLAQGLAALGHQQFPEACEAFAELSRLDARDFAAWHGLGECRTRDNVVVTDPASPSGWRFRGSYHAGVDAYRRAYQILPSSHLQMRDGGLGRLQGRFFTRALRFRPGRTVTGDSHEFISHPAIADDTLVFVPVPFEQWSGGDAAAWRAATARQRRVFAGVARAWVAAYPNSADAAYAQAVALDMLGDPTSVGWARRARALEEPGAGSYELAAANVWLELRYGSPDTSSIAAAVAIADSLLASAEVDDSVTARALAPLAALIGRPSLAARLAATLSDADVPMAVSRPANALLAFASLGAPVDSIRVYEQRTLDAIRNVLPPMQHARARGLLLELPAQLAFPAFILDALTSGAMHTSAGTAQSAWVRGDEAYADSLLFALREPPVRPADSSPEALYATARLFAIAGDTASAVRWLDSLLGALRWFPPDTFDRLGDAGVIGRAMALRARLAQTQEDDETARIWSRAVAALWADGEPHFRSVSAHIDAP